jgi:ferredoxin-NADP reductase
VRALLEGPFGSPAVDLLGPRYRVVLLISGGIGITPCQALLNDLVAQAERGRPMRRLMLVWSVRDKQMVHR